jgi:flagellar hook-basal body protein
MLRAMFAGVSGLKVHQTRLDVIGNNIANVNTAGYKASRATFQEMLSQTIRGATAPTDARGGSNPLQVGLGVQLGSIDVKHTQGNTQTTGYGTDLAIEGDGFFVLGEGENRVYTRAGIFGLDNGTEGNLVSLVNGQRVLGYKADQDGIIDPNGPLQSLYISAMETITPKATDRVYFGGNLDSRTTPGTNVPRTIQVYDSRGGQHTLEIGLTYQGENTWAWTAKWQVVSNRIPVSEAGDIVSGQEYTVEHNVTIVGSSRMAMALLRSARTVSSGALERSQRWLPVRICRRSGSGLDCDCVTGLRKPAPDPDSNSAAKWDDRVQREWEYQTSQWQPDHVQPGELTGNGDRSGLHPVHPVC